MTQKIKLDTLHLTKNDKSKIVLALGFFDSLHIGHRKLIALAREKAAVSGAQTAVFTFSNNPYSCFGSGRGEVLLFCERIDLLKKLHVDTVFSMDMNPDTMNLSPKEFIAALLKCGDVSAVVCGKDYTFGKGGDAGLETLKKLLGNVGIPVYDTDFVMREGQKVSTTLICQMIESGKIEDANALLCDAFSIAGTVKHGYEIGRTLGFPTANVDYPNGKVRAAEGVYLTRVHIDGGSFYGISNVGHRPTFSDPEFKVETYIDGFTGDLYERRIGIAFLKFMRRIQKFDSKMQLAEQLEKDKEIFKTCMK